MLVLCGGGGVGAYLMLRGTESGVGTTNPVAAVENFLQAVYKDKDASKAEKLVCAEARDREAIDKKVAEVKKYDTTYKSPRYGWLRPKVEDENDERAIVSVEVRLTTNDEKTSTQNLTFTVVNKEQDGWWICEVAA